jgi:UPF0176 protein
VDPAADFPYQVLLYYLYVAIPDPESYCERHRQLCAELGLRGRILIGREGINGTVSGEKQATETYMATLRCDPLTAPITFKVDPAEGHVFPRLSVKRRPEIVTLGLPPEEDIDPQEITGERLSPKAFYEAMHRPDAVVLDGRNDYESALGHFKGALCPPLRNFREFPDWIREHEQELRGKTILTYCTGGIRCEKLSGYLKQQGFDRVYQLDGGIVSYGKDPEVQGRDFEGLCYVFDERIGVEVNHTETRRVISHCRHCGVEEPHYGNCQLPSCNAQIFVCPACREQFGLYCDERCRSAS